jgi:hypothetical protein
VGAARHRRRPRARKHRRRPRRRLTTVIARPAAPEQLDRFEDSSTDPDHNRLLPAHLPEAFANASLDRAATRALSLPRAGERQLTTPGTHAREDVRGPVADETRYRNRVVCERLLWAPLAPARDDVEERRWECPARLLAWRMRTSARSGAAEPRPLPQSRSRRNDRLLLREQQRRHPGDAGSAPPTFVTSARHGVYERVARPMPALAPAPRALGPMIALAGAQRAVAFPDRRHELAAGPRFRMVGADECDRVTEAGTVAPRASMRPCPCPRPPRAALGRHFHEASRRARGAAVVSP